MSLGDRCDDIVRLIDETLVSLAAESGAPTDTAARAGTGDRHGRRAHPSSIVAGGRRRRPHVIT